MGGNAAKERRRLKRLAEQGGSEGETVKRPIVEDDKSESKKQKLNRKSPTKQSFQKVNFLKGSNKRINGKSSSKTPIKGKPTMTKKKVKKPKHLARKMQLTQDPKELEELEKKQNALESKKKERAEKFKDKVMKMVGGKDKFDEDAFHKIMESGGGKLETIVDASTRKLLNDDKDKTTEKDVSSTDLYKHDTPKDMDGLDDKNEDESTSSSSDSGDEGDDKITTERKHDSSSSKSLSSSSSSSSSDSDESSDDEVDTEHEKRTRGRRRRGLKDIDTKREELNKKQQKETEVQKSTNKEDSTNAKTKESETKKTPKSEDKRRCIGRKPLTDFVVGKRYTGTVQYIKPNLGLFIDIGCHNDAFCHISRSSDEYVESLESLYQVGDVLTDKVRVVDVDRKKKRITVSLQSDMKIEAEEKSQREYNERRQAKLEKKQMSMESKSAIKNDFHANDEMQHMESNEYSSSRHDEASIIIDPETMTPAELKRARKLQRRQERRAAGISA